MIKKINIIIPMVLLLVFSCKREDKHSENNTIQTAKDTLLLDNEDVLIVYPSEKEMLKLKKELGKDIFYLTADGENGYFSHIYEILDKEKIKYKIFNKHQVAYSKKHNVYVNKAQIDNPWGVVLLKNGEYSFTSTVRFLEFTKNKQKIIKSNEDKNNETSSIIDDDSNVFFRYFIEATGDPRTAITYIIEDFDYTTAIFRKHSYDYAFEYECTKQLKKGILKLYHKTTISGENYNSNEPLITIYKKNNSYYATSPIIKNGQEIELTKNE